MKKEKKILLDVIRSKEYRPMKAKEISLLLGNSKKRLFILQEYLDDLEEEGLIKKNKKGQYVKCLSKTDSKLESLKREHRKKKMKNKLYSGIFIGNRGGFGFVETEEAGEDIFIAKEDRKDAMHKDLVQFFLKEGQKGKRREGIICKVLEHGLTSLVGTFWDCKNYGFVVADNPKIFQDIFIPKEKTKGAKTGDKVVVCISKYAEGKQKPEGIVSEILGALDERGVDITSIVKDKSLPFEFPAKVEEQANRIRPHIIEADFNGRKDLRDLLMVTIDGEDARDLDDAVSLTKEGENYCLGVHIADVSNYVQYRSALDREALKRGTSVYLPDRVIPMLPKALSNGICSLNQREDRLALSCLMKIDGSGRVIEHEIAETVICVNERMTYKDVSKILLREDEALSQRYKKVEDLFFLMQELSQILRAKRKGRGGIDFDFPEAKIRLNEEGKAIEVYTYQTNAATEIIEDFMLIANETVAEEFAEKKIPFVYRSHDLPDRDKMEAALTFIRENGVEVKKKKADISPKEVDEILERIRGQEKESIVARILLRSMKQASYTTDCSGHFGLAAKYYCHFTSPIRRYPDLQIHRIIKDCLRGRMSEEKKASYQEILPDVARHCCETQRRADETEREAIKLKKAEYMSNHIGEIFDGIISGITAWGLYVELENTVEGLVPLGRMTDDYYIYDEVNYRLIGEDRGKIYSFGQRVKVEVLDVSIEDRSVDFQLKEDL